MFTLMKINGRRRIRKRVDHAWLHETERKANVEVDCKQCSLNGGKPFYQSDENLCRKGEIMLVAECRSARAARRLANKLNAELRREEAEQEREAMLRRLHAELGGVGSVAR
jgi:hypothetical protein